MLILISFIYFLLSVSAGNTQENKTETTEQIQVQSKANESQVTINDKINKTNIEMMRITKPSTTINKPIGITNISMIKENNGTSAKFKPSPQLESYIEFNNYPVIPEAKRITPKLSYLPPVITQDLLPPNINTYQQFEQPNTNFEQKKNELRITNYENSKAYLPPTTEKSSPAEEKELIFPPPEKPVRFETDFPSLKFYERYNYGPSFQHMSYPTSFDWYSKFTYPTKENGLSAGDQPYPFVVSDMTKQSVPNLVPQKPIIIVEDKFKNQRMAPWKQAAKFLATIVPIGLLLSALTPNILTITPANETQFCRKLNGRSENSGKRNELTELFSKPGCEARLLCETAVNGNTMDIETVKSLFWTLVSRNAEEEKTSMELEAVSNAIRAKTCDKIPCRETKSTDNNG